MTDTEVDCLISDARSLETGRPVGDHAVGRRTLRLGLIISILMGEVETWESWRSGGGFSGLIGACIFRR